MRDAMDRALALTMEAIVLAAVVCSPWAFAGVHAEFEFYLYAALAILLLLWAARIVAAWRFSWRHCPAALGLAGLFLLAILQLIPWPAGTLDWLSPGTARLLQELLPERHEAAADPGLLAAGQRLSLYPAATRGEALRLLAVFLLYAVVRSNLSGPASLRRLSIAAVVNGAALSLFALAHAYSAEPQTLYWIYPTGGTPYGPFVCRNHFTFYINLCLGLGIGLLLERRGEEGEGLRRLLNQPALLWLALALALMLAAGLLSLSRGGFLALLGAGVLLILVQRGVSRPHAAGLLAACLALALAGWLGLGAVQARWKTPLEEGRLTSWSNTLPLALAFPLWGTGLGTYQHVEPLNRPLGQQPADIWEHAHNDYLEALVEGGILRLGLSLWIIVLVYGIGLRAVRRLEGQRGAGLALGALFAFTTTVIHSFVDFGLHVPAIAWLATVIVALLAGLTDEETNAAAAGAWLDRLLPALAVPVLIGLALLLFHEGQRAAWAERQRLRAAVAADPAQQLQYRSAAVLTAPANALLHQDLAETHYRMLQQQDSPRHFQAAAKHFLAARDLCPLLPLPQLRLAALSVQLAGAEPSAAYARRAARLRPFDPEVWYLLGLQEWQAGDWAAAWHAWQQSIRGSDRRLDAILDQARPVLTTEQMLLQLLPADPILLLTAAERLYPRAEDSAARLPILDRALEILEAEGNDDPERHHLRARLLRSAGRTDQARQAYEAALARRPNQAAWRYELAELLYLSGQPREARDQLQVILAMQPGHSQAAALLRELTANPP